MKKSDFDYDEKTDDLPNKIMVWVVISALLAAVYLSQILV
jgi:hypothetical protein